MKSFTSIEQSKTLAKILPIESADMAWCNNSIKGVNYTDQFSANLHTVKEMRDVFDEALRGWDKYWELIPCWSLVALLDIVPKGEYKDIDLCYGGYEGDKYVSEWFCSYEEQNPFIIEVCHADNPIDACVGMIIKLNELKLLCL